MTESTRGSQAAADVAALLRARNPLLWIVTREEARTERFIMEAAQVAQYAPRFWDCATGVTEYGGEAVNNGVTDPGAVFNLIRDSKKREVWVLRDMPAWFRNPTVLRACRSLARALPLAQREQARAVILLTPSSDIPPELAGHAIVIEWPLPDRAEIRELLDTMEAGIKAADPETIRQAANKARELGAMLSEEVAGKVSEAINQARTAARAIVTRVQKAGEDAAQVVADLSVRRIEEARFLFLDLDEGAKAEPIAPAARGLDLPAGEDPAPAPAPQSALSLDFTEEARP